MSYRLRDMTAALAELIANRVPDLAGRVWPNRNAPIRAERCPCANVFVVRESANPHTYGPIAYLVTVEFGIEIVLAVGAGVEELEAEGGDRRLFELLELVRQPLTADETLQGFATQLRWKGTEFDLLEPGGEFYFLAGRLLFEGDYIQETPAAGTTDLAPFRSMGVETDGAPAADGSTDAQDNVTLDR